jgi:hypothetical protein
MMMEAGSAFPGNTTVYRHVDPTEDFRTSISTTAKRIGAARPQYRFYGASKSLGSSAFGKKAQARLTKYLGRLDTCPKKMFCSEFVINVVQIAANGVPGRYFIPLDALRTWPSTLESWLKKSSDWKLVGGWRRNPEKYGTDEGGM